jgi:homoserine dehydrogenase
MQIARVAIAGFGNVGRETAALLLSRRDRYRVVYGIDVRLVAVCGSRAGAADPAGLEADGLDHLEDGRSGPDFIAASGADLLIEAGPSDFRTGGPGLAYIRSALAAGHDAIVISKGALVRDGRHLRDLASATGATLKISGATAAALPTIDLLDHSLKGCVVLAVEGVLNATTNYLLNAMTTRGIGFDAALEEAQASGFAERDPRNDVEGWDTACKLLILANFGLGADLSMGDLTVQGIQSITRGQIDAWTAGGLVPRLVGTLSRTDETWRGAVGVRLYPRDDPFAHLPGKTKAIRIVTDAMGEIVAIGGGPEPTATASAALKDLEHILASRSRRAGFSRGTP